MRAKTLHVQLHIQVRNIFVLVATPALRISMCKNFKVVKYTLDDGKEWIFTSRTKTNKPSHIPILAEAKEILDRYKNHLICDKGIALPVYSNQGMISYLKEIAVHCGITKTLTFHLARHTFATTVTLSNGVPIETVSKMLGHNSLKVIQHYAKVLDSKTGVLMPFFIPQGKQFFRKGSKHKIKRTICLLLSHILYLRQQLSLL